MDMIMNDSQMSKDVCPFEEAEKYLRAKYNIAY